MTEEISDPVAYARMLATWWRGWRGELFGTPRVSAEALQAAKAAHAAVFKPWSGRQPMVSEVADSWDRAADLLEKGGTP